MSWNRCFEHLFFLVYLSKFWKYDTVFLSAILDPRKDVGSCCNNLSLIQFSLRSFFIAILIGCWRQISNLSPTFFTTTFTTPIKLWNGCFPLKTWLRIKCVPETLNRSSPSYSWIVFVELPLYLFLLQIVKNVYLFIYKYKTTLLWLYHLAVYWKCMATHSSRFPPFPDAGFWLFNRATCQNEKLPLGLNQKNTKK